ncbi:MAG: carbohydrate-binding family 9-like protein [Planctomycetia bacterium]|nr:carbohydrate-binding family 9-like protein [Planctomycetia bacterium]
MRTALVLLLGIVLLRFGLATSPGLAADPAPTLRVPKFDGEIRIDGKLDEDCYRRTEPLADFHVAGRSNEQPPRTRAWVFWRERGLVVAFECDDARLVAEAPAADEMLAAAQDRVEIFLWDGRPESAYPCVEMAARGAVLDYSARFYRRFDNAWSLKGLKCAARVAGDRYWVEAELPADAIRPLGITLAEGKRCRGGLFRGDYRTGEKDEEPVWITWVNAPVEKPDFHIAASFGTFVFVGSP